MGPRITKDLTPGRQPRISIQRRIRGCEWTDELPWQKSDVSSGGNFGKHRASIGGSALTAGDAALGDHRLMAAKPERPVDEDEAE